MAVGRWGWLAHGDEVGTWVGWVRGGVPTCLEGICGWGGVGWGGGIGLGWGAEGGLFRGGGPGLFSQCFAAGRTFAAASAAVW